MRSLLAASDVLEFCDNEEPALASRPEEDARTSEREDTEWPAVSYTHLDVYKRQNCDRLGHDPIQIFVEFGHVLNLEAVCQHATTHHMFKMA